MSYVLAHLAALAAFAAAFGLAGFALERAWLRDVGLGSLRPLARAVLGVVAWIVALFALAAAGLLTSTGVALVAAASAFAAAAARARWGSAGEGSGTPAFAAVVFVATSPLLLLSLSQEVSWDASAYHLTLPARWLEAGGFVSPPMNVYAHGPLSTELLFAAAMGVQDHALAKALHAGFGLATLWAAMLGARAFHRASSGWLAAPLVLANPVVLFEWSVAYVDLAYAFFFLSGVLFATRWRGGGAGAREALWLAGLCGGAMAGIKPTGVLGSAAIGAVVALPLVRRSLRGGARDAIADALRYVAPVLLLWAPWLVKSAFETGNPFYPALHGVFGGPDWSPELSQQLTAWLRRIGMGRSMSDYALLPLRVIVDGGPGYDRFGGALGVHWLAVLPLALAGRRVPLVRTAATAAAAYFVLWAATSQQMRFLVPILPPLALAGAVGTVELAGRLRDPRVRRGVVAVLGVVAALFALHTARRPLAAAAALLPQLARGGEALRDAARHPVHRFVAGLPKASKLLLLNTNQGFFLERAYLADSFFEASQIADWLGDAGTPEEVAARLHARGVTHVLRERRDQGIAWPEALVALLADPRRAAPRYRSDDGRFEVFALRTPDPPAAGPDDGAPAAGAELP